MAVHVVLLAGGRGTRFWPLSRRRKPKQFLPLVSGESLLRQTWLRTAPLARPASSWVITAGDLRSACLRELPEFLPAQCIGEPVGRNTAAAIALATALVAKRDPRGVLAIFPSDHFIGDPAAFRRLARRAIRCAREERALVLLGIEPARPETGYGYIEMEPGSGEVRLVKRFLEKPSSDRAQAFLRGGGHLWNSGMFFLSVPALIAAWREHAPEIWEPLSGVAEDFGGRRFAARLRSAYAALPALPFDVAVMEKARGVKVVPAEMGWSDLGNWISLEEMLPERDGNHSAGPLVSSGAKGNIVMDREGLTALIGVENLVVVRSGDTVLVCHRDRVQDLRQLVAQLDSEELKRYV